MGEVGLSKYLSEEKPVGRSFLKIAVPAALWLSVILWYIITPGRETVEKFYSLGFYRFFMPAVTSVTNALNFSVFPLLFITAVFLFFGFWVRNWIIIKKKEDGSHGKGFKWGINRLFLFILPVIWLWFMIFWGFGYYRLTIEERLLLEEREIPREELIAVERGLLEIIQRDQPLSDTDRNVERAIRAAAVSMMKIVEEWDGKPVKIPETVKFTRPGALLIGGTSGICMPFTLEPYVDGGLPETSRVMVGVHELGHLTGLGDEGETNMVAYAAGILADDSYARYAVALGLYESIARLRGENAYDRAVALLPEQARNDISLREEAYKRYASTWLQDLSWRTYNLYLKLQGVEEGVLSYQQGANLFVQALQAGHLNQNDDCPLFYPAGNF